jgi:DNA polymerase/3'-5' exonuclease PolX
MDYKPAIIQALDILRRRDLAEKQPFRARAYDKVIRQLKSMAGPVRTMENMKDIQGVGDKITEKILEILNTGQLKTAEVARETYSTDALTAFSNIYGVGSVKAKELVQRGFKTIDQLITAIKTDPTLLNDKQKVGLQYYEDLLQRIPREEMDQHRVVLQCALSSKPVVEAEIVGSYRRHAETSGDIDMLIRTKNTNKAAQKAYLNLYATTLKEQGYVEEILALGEHKCMAICRLSQGLPARRLDILLVPDEEYAYSVLYFTGSDRFNVAFRQHALSKGYTLNEHTLKPLPSQQLVVAVPLMKTERDIFRFLGLTYVAPEKRVDHQQIVPKKQKYIIEADSD